jgi:hypothetical protein
MLQYAGENGNKMQSSKEVLTMWYAVCRLSVAGFIDASAALVTLGASSIKVAAMYRGSPLKRGFFRRGEVVYVYEDVATPSISFPLQRLSSSIIRCPPLGGP